MKKTEIESGQELTCICKEKVIRRWVAVTPDGKELDIKGIDAKKLKNGLILKGVFKEDHKQDQYTDGSYASTYSTFTWLEVNDTHPEFEYTTTEIVQKMEDGTEKVKYRRPYGSKKAKELMAQVDDLTNGNYFYRHI